MASVKVKWSRTVEFEAEIDVEEIVDMFGLEFRDLGELRTALEGDPDFLEDYEGDAMNESESDRSVISVKRG